MLDLIVQGGTVVDGTGSARYRADVGVRDGRIEAVGDLAAAEAARRLDATGLLVTPGFIDIHSHSDFTLLVDPRAQSSIVQGVTTEVIGNCGHGCAPITDPELFKGNIYGYTPALEIDWSTTAEYLQRLDAGRPAVNVAALVPNGNLRLAAVSDLERPATPDEVREMLRLLEEGLEAGAFGYSTGLEYPAERACPEEETIELCRAVARAGGLYATHERNKEVYAVEAVEEGIRVAQAAGVRLQVSHIIPRRGGPDDARERAIAAVERAHDRGMDVGFDAHTRLHGITNVSAALPAWAFEGGADQLAVRLRDPATRAKMKSYESLISSFGLGGWDRVFLFKSESSPDMVGKSFQELAPPGGDAFDAIFDLLLEEIDDPQGPMCVCHSYEEDELRQTFEHPLCTLESDATALGVDGPLAGTDFLGAYTWAAWFLRRFVRETPVFTWEQAVHKLTAMPAERIGLGDRGRIEAGARADVVALDPDGVREQGTLETPSRLAEGVAHVVVNGGVTMEGGTLTGDRSGQVLRRS
jgi:N-acyl-D-aspartate/D-glutamate deacylase